MREAKEELITDSLSSCFDSVGESNSKTPNPVWSKCDDNVIAPISHRQFGTASKSLSEWRPRKRNAVLAVIVSTIGSFCLGSVLTFSAPVLVDEDFKKKFPDVGNGSWVATTAVLGALLAAPVSGVLIAKIGRKRTMLLSAIPFSAGWAMIAVSPNLALLYTGRFITGFCAGVFTVAVPAYICEVSEDKVRGALGVTFILMLTVGTMFTFVLGAFANWFVLSVACGCIPIILFFCMLCMPESPRYLIQAQEPIAARKALKWLRRASKEIYVEPEILLIEDSVNRSSGENNGISKFTDYFTGRVLKPVVIASLLMFFAQFSGMNGVLFYTVEIFQEAGTGMDANIASILIGATQILSVIIVPFFLVEKLGRVSLLLVSEVVMFVSLLALGTFFYLKEQNGGGTPENLAWLPLVSLIMITIGYNVGLGTIPWVITSEILPNDAKEVASACISIAYWALSFAAGKSFQDSKDIVGYMGVYWISAGVCFIGTFFVYFYVPETKGKSVEEIQQIFNPRKESVQFKTEAPIQISEESKTVKVRDDGIGNPSFVDNEVNFP